MGFFYIIHVVICILLVVTILFQDGKAGGLTSVADSSQAVFGARGATSFLTKLTSVLAVIFMITSISLAFMNAPSDRSIASDYKPETPVTETEKVKPAEVPAGDVEVIDPVTGEKTTKKLSEAVKQIDVVSGDDVPEEIRQAHEANMADRKAQEEAQKKASEEDEKQ